YKMKKLILTSFLGLGIAVMANAQTSDTVRIGAGYANQVWYSLANDEQGSAPKDNWDLAFDIQSIMSSIHVNTVAGVTLWGYPNGDITDWGSVDTTGLSGWGSRNNSDTSWSLGA